MNYFAIEINDTVEGRTYEPVVLLMEEHEAKLVYVEPPLDTHKQALERVRECYPGSELVGDYRELSTLWKNQGWVKPRLQCNAFCLHCDNAYLSIHPEWEHVGYNAPMGSLVSQFCYCPRCHQEYCHHWQERQHGVDRWWTMEREDGTWPINEATTLKTSEERNPFHFREVELKDTLEYE